jgi:hypothetical protein
MWRVKYLAPDGTEIWRCYKMEDCQVRKIANSEFKRHGWRMASMIKEY